MRRKLVWLPCVLWMGVALGCHGGADSGVSPKGGASAGQSVIAVIPKCTGSEFWETVEVGARAAAAELDVAMKWEGTQKETEIAEQNKIIENMINLEVDGIALAPLNPRAMRKTVQQAVDAGIPVVIFDSGIDGKAQSSFVATNNKEGGAMGCRQLGKLLGDPKGKKVLVLRFVQGTASTEARAEGFLETARSLGMEVLADPFSEGPTVAGCKKTAANVLEGYVHGGKLEVDGLFACNDRSSLGMLGALEDLRKSGIAVNTKFVGFDSPRRMVDAMVEGKVDAIVVQDPKKMGYLAVKTLVACLRGEKVEPFIDTGVRMVTAQALKDDASARELVGMKE